MIGKGEHRKKDILSKRCLGISDVHSEQARRGKSGDRKGLSVLALACRRPPEVDPSDVIGSCLSLT